MFVAVDDVVVVDVDDFVDDDVFVDYYVHVGDEFEMMYSHYCVKHLNHFPMKTTIWNFFLIYLIT